MADQLATPADLASLLQQDVDTATATLLLETATGIVQTVTGQRIVQVVNDVVVLDVEARDHDRWLSLPQRPVTAVSAVLLGATSLASSDYSVQLSRGRLWRIYGWRLATTGSWLAPTTVTVTYTHGYAAGDQRLQTARQAALSLAASAYSNPAGATREQIDDYQVAYEAMSARMEAAPALQALLRRQYGRAPGSVQLTKAHAY
jgi:hypothetical protein